MDPIERFWTKVEKLDDGCWRWNAGRTPFGYGAFWFQGRQIGAHRFSWFVATGALPKLQILHSCDHPWCVNPSHMREGTQAENLQDAIGRGRLAVRGEGNSRARLTVVMVRAIRSTPIVRGSISQLSRKYGVERRTIRQVLQRLTWAHVD